MRFITVFEDKNAEKREILLGRLWRSENYVFANEIAIFRVAEEIINQIFDVASFGQRDQIEYGLFKSVWKFFHEPNGLFFTFDRLGVGETCSARE
jgi:hypothetical protein